MVIVGSKLKAYVKSKKMQSSGDLLEALNEKAHMLLDDAMKRTQSNGRSTVRAGDL